MTRFYRKIIAFVFLAWVIGVMAFGVKDVIKYYSLSEDIFFDDSLIKMIDGSSLERWHYEKSNSYSGTEAHQILLTEQLCQ